MDLERRGFMGKALAAGAGIWALTRSAKTRADGLPSDPAAGEAAAGPEEIALPGFEKDGAFPLERALLERRSDRKFDDSKPLSRDQLSRLLWAANGMNRPGGYRTTPSAVARYPVDIYVTLAEGAYKYDVKGHRLVRVLDRDIRAEVPRQPGLKRAAMNVLYVARTGLLDRGSSPAWADLEIGCMVQNLYLMAAGLGLGSCVFAIVRYDEVSKLMGFKRNETLRIAQAVGPVE